MMTLETTTRVLVLMVSTSLAWGCGGEDSSNASSEGSSSDDSEPADGRTIERETFTDNRFKPESLETTIDDLVEDIEDAKVSEDFALGVVLKELTDFWRPVNVGATRAMSELEIVGSVQGTTQEDLSVPESVAE